MVLWGVLLMVLSVLAVAVLAWRGVKQLEEQQRASNRRALERVDFLDWEIELAMEEQGG